MRLSVDVEGVDRLLHGLRAAPETIDAANREAIGKAVFFLEAAVKARTPRVTGRLFSSINGSVSQIGGLHGRVGTNVNYARFVESGRGPIFAKGKALKFRGPDGRMIFRRSVGPAAGRFMFREGLAASKDAIHGFFREAAKHAAALIAKGG